MARVEMRYVCRDCGAAQARWSGRCDACGAWNSVSEEAPREASPRGLGGGRGRRFDFVPLDGPRAALARRQCGIVEIDRVVGSGFVPGSTILLAGDPGIGKSTLLLQVAAALTARDIRCAYISGEEGIEQIRMRAARLGLAETPVRLATAINVRDIATSLQDEGPLDLIVVDSIQTMYLDTLDSAPGSVAQVRAGAQELIRLAKRTGAVLLLVGHVTKEGQIAGPRVLEHMVDCVLYFEGERGHQFRIVRAIKNRFGPTDEIGVFEMTDRGLVEIPNPSSLFVDPERGPAPGAAVFAGVEGSRPVLVEIQALVAPGLAGSPRRTVVGWDAGRLAMVLAVLEARGGLRLSACDVYLNVAGGLRITEPAADLAVAAALASSAADQALDHGAVMFGEVGLAGEIRPVSQSAARLKEAAKLGFTHALAPEPGSAKGAAESPAITVKRLTHVHDLIALFPAATRRTA